MDTTLNGFPSHLLLNAQKRLGRLNDIGMKRNIIQLSCLKGILTQYNKEWDTTVKFAPTPIGMYNTHRPILEMLIDNTQVTIPDR